MINVGIVTSTRAEYGLLRPVYLELQKHKCVKVKLIASGTHLSEKYGYTIKDIVKDGIKVDKKLFIIDDDKKNESMAEVFSKAISEFDKYLKRNSFDTIVLLGDRYETLAFATACMFNKVPITHLHGGETTEGVIDEAIRHSITKMSYLHFTSCEEHRKRVIQLGENPSRVYNVGSIGVENILKIDFLSKAELSSDIEFNLDKYFVVTYHPVTLSVNSSNEEFKNLLKVLEKYKDFQVIFTKSNADAESFRINKMIDSYVLKHKNAKAFYSLGTRRYLSLIKYSSAVIGNSSSGIIEAPAMLVPTVNIGDRQKGRIRAKSVLDCDGTYNSISRAIKKALITNCKFGVEDIPFYKKNTSKRIADTIIRVFNKKVDLMKKFYDLKV